MDKIAKALNKLSDKEKQSIKELLIMIQSGKLSGLDVKKLKGRDDIYRIRKGKLRIIYTQKDGKIYILAVERRNDKTYNR